MTARVAVVTGAARGIGAATAIRLAQDGCDIAVIDLDEPACALTIAAIKALGRRALAIACDVGSEEQTIAAIQRVADTLGPPLILVNNAGLFREKAFAKLETGDWDQLIAVNLRSAFLMSRAVLPHMKAAGWGRIVNLSSTAALGAAGQANYAAAKAGIQGLTKALAIELGRHGITVNAVAPGFVATAMTAAVAERVGIPLPDMIANEAKSIAAGRVGEPQDVAHAVAFFADDRSGFVSGQILYVAGGPRG